MNIVGTVKYLLRDENVGDLMTDVDAIRLNFSQLVQVSRLYLNYLPKECHTDRKIIIVHAFLIF